MARESSEMDLLKIEGTLGALVFYTYLKSCYMAILCQSYWMILQGK